MKVATLRTDGVGDALHVKHVAQQRDADKLCARAGAASQLATEEARWVGGEVHQQRRLSVLKVR
jgi:hypothetical protein